MDQQPVNSGDAASVGKTVLVSGDVSPRALDPSSVSATRALVWLWWGVMLGLAVQLQQPMLWSASIYAGLCLCGFVLGWWWRKPVGRSWQGLLLLLAASIGMAGLTGWRADARAQDRLAPALEGVDLDITGVVAAMPQGQQSGWRLQVQVLQARTPQGTPVQLPQRLALGWYDSSARYEPLGWSLPQAALPAVHAGELWQWRVRLKAPHGQLNPGGFDHELWLWEQGLGATGYVRSGRHDPPPRRLAQTWQHPVETWRQRVRDALLMPGADHTPARAVLAALVTGDQAVIERAQWDVFRATGVAHLMSISGLHITMLAWAMAAWLRFVWRLLALAGSRWPLRWPAPLAGALGGLAFAAAYAVFSGWGVPAQRTVLMLAIVTALQLGGLRWPWVWIWAAAALGVVLVDPWAVLQAGFWLSFVAVGALLLAGQVGQSGTKSVPEGLLPVQGAMLGRVWRASHALLREQLLITAALTPLGVLFFGQVSLVGLLANLLAIPWVSLCVTPLALLGIALPPAWDLAQALLQPLLALLEGMATWPWAQVHTARAPLWLALPAVLGGLWLAWPGAGPLRLLGLVLIWPALVWQAPRPSPGDFELLMADVGQGTAVLVRTSGHTLLYDTGPRYSPESDAGHRVVRPLLQALGDRPDAVVLSHSDTDHTGGAEAVHAAYPQAKWWSSLQAGHPLLLGLAQRSPLTHEACAAGQRWQWDGVVFEFLHPQWSVAERAPPNALSCVLRVSNPKASALLTGDVEAAQETSLLGQGLAPVDLLLVPHHGSRTSSTRELLEQLRPRWSVVQAGYRNRFGHPSPLVRERYAALELALVETATCGAARWRSAQPQALDCERQQQARYWHHRTAEP